MVKVSGIPRRSRSRKILIMGRKHWDHDGYDQNARRAFLLAVQCKTPALGARQYGSENEEWEFCNTCKSGVACTSCGNWSTTHWQRDRDWALPDIPYVAVTLTMPDTLWPLFNANPHLRRKLEIIAARVIMSYTRVRKGIEVGAMPILQTFNGKLEFNPHVHMLVTAGDLLTVDSGSSSFYFDGDELSRSWQRLLIALLRNALAAGAVRSAMSRVEVEDLLQREEKRTWRKTHVKADKKEHFLHYGGRYLRRPPITEGRILGVTDGFVRFGYNDKRTKRREIVVCSIEEFIDRWAQHIPQPYRHTVRYFGHFAPRRWAKVGEAIFAILGTPRGRRPKHRPWAFGIQDMGKPNPLLDSKGRPMHFVRHVAPIAI